MTTIRLENATCAGLVAAIKGAAPGDTVLVPGGAYDDTFNLDAVDKPGLVVRAADKRTMPIFSDRFTVKNCNGITFSDLEFSGSARLDMPVQITNCNAVTVAHCFLHGALDGTPNDLRGLLVRTSSKCMVVQCWFEELSDAMNWLDSPGLIVRQNVFWHIADNAMCGGGCSNLEIGGNVTYELVRLGSDTVHPDAIQNWGTVQNPQPTNLLFRDNVFVRGPVGWLSQGVFVSDCKVVRNPDDTPRDAKYPGTVKVTGNIGVGAIYNGMTVFNAENVSFADNINLGTQDQQTWMSSRTGPTNTAFGEQVPGPVNATAHFKNNLTTRHSPTMWGAGMQAMGDSTAIDDGGNLEVPALSEDMAALLYADFLELFEASGRPPESNPAVGFVAKYRARILERLEGQMTPAQPATTKGDPPCLL